MKPIFRFGALSAVGWLAYACGGAVFTTAADGGGAGGGETDGASDSDVGGSGGSTSSSGAASSGSGGGAGSSGGSSSGCVSCADAGATSCPPTAPASGASCLSGDAGLACQYGSNPVLSCDTVASCDSGQWSVTVPDGVDCTTGLGPDCPTTFGVAAEGGSCSSSGVVCNYAEGRCECTTDLGVVAQPIEIVDASASIDHWYCQDPTTPGCPVPRPPLGSACALPSADVCDYGSCDVIGGTSQSCQDGVWQQVVVGCPAAAAP